MSESFDSHPEMSNVTLHPPADFSSPRFGIIKHRLECLPSDLLLLYSVHNGMTFYLSGAMRKEEK